MVSVSAHLALTLALLLRPQPAALAAGPADIITVSLVDAPPAPEPAESIPPPSLEPQADLAAAEAPAPPEAEAAAPAEPQAGGAETAGSCAVSDAVLAALQTEASRRALQRIPRPRRSAANALMLWDGGWIRTGALADASVARPIRSAIVEAVRTAGRSCADAPVTGPVLLIVPEEAGAVVLVVGSGTWRWSDIAKSQMS